MLTGIEVNLEQPLGRFADVLGFFTVLRIRDTIYRKIKYKRKHLVVPVRQLSFYFDSPLFLPLRLPFIRNS